MAVTGFVSHAARNRRLTAWFLALYAAGFFCFTLLILSPLPVIFGASERSLFLDPVRYFFDYAPFAAIVPVLAFAWNRYTFAGELKELLRYRDVDAGDEPRFAGLAMPQATLQGLKSVRLGIIETPAINALTVGALGSHPRIVVTRGLLDALDDDEIGNVLAHEIAHWRLGDTRLLTLNQVLMRTANALQATNPIKVERHPHHSVQWHLLFGLIYPFWLVALFVGGLLTMGVWSLSRYANRKVRAGRDLIADAEALRMNHFPEALESAIGKAARNGWFEHAERFEAMLFAGATPDQGGTQASPEQRIASMRDVAADMYQPSRVRADTRQAGRASAPARAGFGRRAVPAGGFEKANATRPELEKWTPSMGKAFWTDADRHKQWRRKELDWFTWRASDERDVFGVARDMRMWAYGSLAAALVIAIPFSASASEYFSYVSGREYLLMADDYFADFTCSLSHSVQECRAIAAEEGRTSIL